MAAVLYSLHMFMLALSYHTVSVVDRNALIYRSKWYNSTFLQSERKVMPFLKWNTK